MALEHFRILIQEFFSKDPDIVPEEALLIVFGGKYSLCMAKNGKDTKHTSRISRRIIFLSNGEKFNMHKFELCAGGMQLADIATNNVGGNDLTPRMKYIMVRIDN